MFFSQSNPHNLYCQCGHSVLFPYLLRLTLLYRSEETTLLHFSVDVVRVKPTVPLAPGEAHRNLPDLSEHHHLLASDWFNNGYVT